MSGLEAFLGRQQVSDQWKGFEYQKAPFKSLAASDLLIGIVVPQYAFAGSSASLSCDYDLRQAQLYSLKWYHNNTEFYRYVPTERSGPINIKPTHKFVLREVSRNDRRVIINLSLLSPIAAGEYRCEIIAEHPSFRTEAMAAVMTVLNDRFYPPVITNAQEIYEPNEVIKIGCQPRAPFRATPQPVIKWYLDGEEVKPEYIAKYGYQPGIGYIGTFLQIPASEILSAGGTVQADCALVLGNLRKQTGRTLRVRIRRQVSYVNSYFSTGSLCTWRIMYFPVFVLLFYSSYL